MRVKIALISLGVFLALGISEIFVCISGLAPKVCAVQLQRFRLSPNPKIGFEPIPHYGMRSCQETAENSLFIDFYHPNEAGHRCAAELLREAVLKIAEGLPLKR